tara:strand:+ start:316 stop:501 length:186 start_codon:yes stop_codon:yes gene_type:complete
MPGKADAVRLIPKMDRAVITMEMVAQSIFVVLIVIEDEASWGNSAREFERCGRVMEENVQK